MKTPTWAQFEMARKAVDVALPLCHEADVGDDITDRLLVIKSDLNALKIQRELVEAVTVPA